MKTVQSWGRSDFQEWLLSQLKLWLQQTTAPKTPRITERYVVKRGHHFHTTPELFIQIRGSTHFKTPGETFSLRNGEVVIIPRGVAHAESTDNKAGDFCNCVVMLNKGQLMAHLGFLTETGDFRGQKGIRLDFPASLQAQRYLEEITMSRMGIHPLGPVGELALWHAFIALAIHASRPENRKSLPESPRITRARHLVHNRIHESRLGAAYLAREIGCNADYLSHQFHLETGIRLSSYITRSRLEFAQELLLTDTALSVSEIAFACGFSSPGYFIKTFKRCIGSTPGDFRASGARWSGNVVN